MDKKLKANLVGLTTIMLASMAAAFLILWPNTVESQYFASAVLFINAVVAAFKLIKL